MLSTLLIYYIETNLICMLFLAFVFYTYWRDANGLSESKWFLAVLVIVQVYCVSDILAAVFKNQTMAGARIMLWISNAVYITIPLILVIFWNQYIRAHIMSYYEAGKFIWFMDRAMTAVALVMCVISLSTPLTHSTFYLDEANGYHRAIGAYLVPLFAYFFMLYETCKLQYIKRHSASLQVKQDTNILSIFAIPCIVFSVVQVLIYGTTMSQVGFTMAIMIIFLGRQKNKISRDELTGLNNRREYEYAIDRLARSSGQVMILMTDVDDFKSINDTYGHLEGDQALKAVAMILRNACANRKDLGSVALYRYGGDEFIMLSTDINIEKTQEILADAIREEADKWNNGADKPYKLGLSVGIICGNYAGGDIYKLIESADQKMYTIKAARKASR